MASLPPHVSRWISALQVLMSMSGIHGAMLQSCLESSVGAWAVGAWAAEASVAAEPPSDRALL